ncbi:MAG TPA: EAL domain-containing protein [Candidatus Dormibacteraeota bacterium]
MSATLRLRIAAGAVALVTLTLILWIKLGVGGATVTTAFDDWIEAGAAAAAGSLCLFAARRPGPARAGWLLLGLSACSWAAGEVIWSYYETILGRAVPFPSLADAGYLLAVPLEVAGVLGLAARFRTASRAVTLLDGFIISGALLYISWVTVLHTVYAAGADSTLALVLSLAYPIGDVVTCVIVLTVIAHSGRVERPLLLIAAGICCLALSDSTFAYLTAQASFKTNVTDVGWVLGYLLIGLAGLDGATTEASTAAARARRLRALVPYVPMAGALGITIAQIIRGDNIDTLATWTLMAVGIAVLLRQLGAVWEAQGLSRELETSVGLLRDREALLEHQAFHDILTNLANRRLFANRVEHALARARRSGGVLALLFLDLDDFKNVNDSLGHAAGDLLLQSTAERLRACVRTGDTCARMSGDEFAVLLEDVEGVGEAVVIATRILEAFRTPFALAREVYVSPSIGIVYARDPEADVAGLIRDADTAMYEAKRRGRGRYAIFEEELRTDVARRLALRSSLAGALERGELSVHYQPIYNLRDMRLQSVEALARWNHEGEWISPDEFIPVAEESGLIVDIGRFVLARACADAAAWIRRDPELRDATIAVNVSALQLAHAGFASDVAAALAGSGLRSTNLVLELTENLLMLESGTVAERLRQLAATGVRLAIDDFGKGYSSLNYLVSFPISMVKIDRAFVAELPGKTNRAVIRSIAMLCRSLDIVTVAEGIETAGQLAELRGLNCDSGQGFWLGRPVPAADLELRAPTSAVSRSAARTRSQPANPSLRPQET